MTKENTKEVKMILTGKGCKTTCQVLAILVKIIEVIAIVGAVVSGIAGILFGLGWYDTSANVAIRDMLLDQDMPITVSGAEEYVNSFFAKPKSVQIATVVGAAVAIAILLVLIVMVLEYMYRFFKDLSHSRTPFSLENVDRLQKMATWLFAVLVFSMVVELIAPLALGVGKVSFSIPVSSFAVGFIMLVLAVVFRHGYELEQKVKEKN